MKRPKQLLIASGNPHKVQELRRLLAPIGIELLSIRDVDGGGDVEEDQPTLEGNALKKARSWHEWTGLPALADDTGLEVDALDGAPGVRSARYAGEPADDGRNVRKLLAELEGTADRTARFRTVIAIVDGYGEQVVEGVCEGEILTEPKGERGFGYDPLFRPKGCESSFAQLEPEEKNRISHRGLALRNVLELFD